MRTTIYYLLISFIILFGCEEEIQPEEIISSVEHAHVFQHSKIDTIYNAQGLTLAASNRGDLLVFSYFFSQEHQANVADDEYEQQLFFEISPTDTIIDITNNLFQKIKLQFKDRCFGNCTGEFIPIHDGTLSLEKIDEKTWFMFLTLNNESIGKSNKIRFIKHYTLQN